MSIEQERLAHLWLKDWRRKLDADPLDPLVKTHLIEVQRMLLDLFCPTVMHDARASLRSFYEHRTVDGDEIPGPPACAGGGCGED